MTDAERSELLVRIDERTKLLVERKDDHEERLRVVEKQVWWFSGGAAVAGTVLAYIGKKLGL